MISAVLRIAGPLQSWSGYRLLAKIDSVVASAAVPRKSGIAGLIGAALGPTDYGFGSARDLSDLGRRFTLHARVDARNPAAEDFQVVSPLPDPTSRRQAERSLRIATASTAAFPTKRGRGNFEVEVSRRDFLSHSEFLVALQTDYADAWCRALRSPVFMPYLGRRSCAPTFPFVLGTYEGDVRELFAEAPWVPRSKSQAPLIAYEITGDYNRHRAVAHEQPYTPTVGTREEQLKWAKERLR